MKGAALEAYNAGDFRGAIIFYFSWILVEADKRELIWLDKGKTNLEYWRELDRNPEVQRIYRVIMNEFELVTTAVVRFLGARLKIYGRIGRRLKC